MGTIICQTCGRTIAQYEDEKVSTLYGVCPNCHQCSGEEQYSVKEVKGIAHTNSF
ncbi:putative HNH restriction endonuclease [Bacillus horti]|uniref:HNH restriction endonuclease n=1 Tax=Caldalkalibacillus horti TaxID=77523 RepID=A0ABT9W131_9BACI|nr:putative HNH restriction endonuclease [Bacillus horti]